MINDEINDINRSIWDSIRDSVLDLAYYSITRTSRQPINELIFNSVDDSIGNSVWRVIQNKLEIYNFNE